MDAGGITQVIAGPKGSKPVVTAPPPKKPLTMKTPKDSTTEVDQQTPKGGNKLKENI